jgi:glycosyltransferase involved in cell wall biosynthesis
MIKVNLHYLWHSPRRYLRALNRTIRQTYREPTVMALAVALFPKSVYFAQQMEELGIDHIHAHFVWLGGIAAGIAADLVDVTFSLHAHAFDIFERNQQDVRMEVEGAPLVVTISNYHRAYLAALCSKMDSERIQIVHLGVDTERFRPPEERANDGPIRILSIGRLVEKKGHQILIEACKLLVERGVAFCCQIVGSGPLHRELQAQIQRHELQKQVRLCGALDHEQVLQLHQSSDVFVLAAVVAQSGDQDGMPYVLIEAMACGLPVVTTPIAGIPDLVSDGENGLLVGQRDPSKLADALARLAADRELRCRLGRNARQTVLKDFEIRCTTDRLAGLFREVSKTAVHA